MAKSFDTEQMAATANAITEQLGETVFSEPIDGGAVAPESELVAARAVLTDIVTRAAADVGVLHDGPVVAALLMLKKHASGEYESLIAKLRAVKGVRLRALEGKIKGAESNLRLVGQGESDIKTLADYFPHDSPLPELTIPAGYWFTDGSTLRLRAQQSPELIAHGAIAVTGRTEDIDGDGKGVRLSWSRGRGWSHRIVNRDVMAEARQLTALAGNDFPVTSVNAKEQVVFLAQLEADNYHRLPVKKTASRFGWMGKKGEEGFLLGGQFITPEGESIQTAIDENADQWDTAGVVFRGNSVGESQIAEGYRPHGNYGDWINAVVKASAYPVVMSTIYASLSSAMLHILDCKNFVYSIDGDTSYGKTSAATAGASVWGSPDVNAPGAAMTTWGTTLYAIERRAAVLRGLPVMLDDTKLAPKVRGEQEIIPKVIYMIASGRAAAKGMPGGLRAETLLETVLITTGEMPAVDFSNDGGTRLRVLEITAKPFGGKSDEIEKVVNHLNREFSANYGHAGPRFVKYLIQNRDKWNKWIDAYRAKIELLIARAADAGIGTGKAGRLAAYVALISQTAEIAHKALELPYTFYDPIETLWLDIARQAEDPLNADRAFDLVISWCNSHQNRFIGREMDDRTAPPSGWAGKWQRQSDEIFIYPHLVDDLLKAKGYPSADAVLRQWKEGGKLRCGTDQLRYTVQVRIRRGESAERVYALKHPNESETQLADDED
jgi:putative DNA primase/helicase